MSQPIEVISPEILDNLDFEETLRDTLLRECLLQRPDGFVSLEYLKEHLTVEATGHYLRSKDIPLDNATLRGILAKSLRLVAILIINRQEQALKLYNLDDTFVFDREEDVPDDFGDRKSFFNLQRAFPPRLTCQYPPRKLPSFFQPSHHPPFLECQRGFRSGSFGIVRQVKIGKGHLPEGTSVNIGFCQPIFSAKLVQDQILAWKSMEWPSDRKSQIRYLQEVRTLKARQHDHMVPLFACYRTMDAQSTVSKLHLFFPWAETDLEEWMNSKQTPNMPRNLESSQFRKKYLYQSIMSLLSAIAYLHREINGIIVTHLDLKPSNILLFGGKWRICDFGKSRMRDVAMGSETEGKDGLGTSTYQPPEYKRGGSQTYGRSFDVWSMGCIIVELAVLVVHGWNTRELSKFEETRKGKRDNNSFRDNLGAVFDWIGRLRRDDGSQNLNYLMDMATAMLSVDREARPYAWEVELDLYEQLNPDNSLAERRAKMKELVQRPQGSTRHTPLARAAAHQKWDRVHYLQALGWHDSMYDPGDVISRLEFRPSSNDLAQIFVYNYNVSGYRLRDTRAEEAPGQVEKLALQFAWKLAPAQLNLFDITQSLALRYPVNLMKVLTNEVKMDHRDIELYLALIQAARMGNIAVIEILLRYGAKTDWSNHRRETPPLIVASRRGNIGVVRRLLQERGPNKPFINSVDRDNRTSLACASKSDHCEIVELLLEHGANHRIRDGGGRTAFSYAAGSGKLDLVDLFFRFIGREDLDITQQDERGWTPLMYAMSEQMRQKPDEANDGQGQYYEIIMRLENES